MAEIRVERKEKRSMLPWILGLLLLALVLWGISEMMGGDDDTVEDTGASARGCDHPAAASCPASSRPQLDRRPADGRRSARRDLPGPEDGSVSA